MLENACYLLKCNIFFALSRMPRCSSVNNYATCDAKYAEESMHEEAIKVGFNRNVKKMRPLDALFFEPRSEHKKGF